MRGKGAGKTGRADVGPPCHHVFSLSNRPDFLLLVIYRVLPAKLATRKSDGLVLSGERSHRPAPRAHNATCPRHSSNAYLTELVTNSFRIRPIGTARGCYACGGLCRKESVANYSFEQPHRC